jgi:hypothetical protein
MISSVINRSTSAIAELNTITKIHKYRGTSFYFDAMEMHCAFGPDMDCFIRECAHLFENR